MLPSLFKICAAVRVFSLAARQRCDRFSPADPADPDGVCNRLAAAARYPSGVVVSERRRCSSARQRCGRWRSSCRSAGCRWICRNWSARCRCRASVGCQSATLAGRGGTRDRWRPPGSPRSRTGEPKPGGAREGHDIDGHLGAAGNGLVSATAETAFIEFAQHQSCQIKCFQRQAANPNHH